MDILDGKYVMKLFYDMQCKLRWNKGDAHLSIFSLCSSSWLSLNQLRIKAPKLIYEYTEFIQGCSFLLWGRWSNISKCRGEKAGFIKRLKRNLLILTVLGFPRNDYVLLMNVTLKICTFYSTQWQKKKCKL